MKKLLLSSLLVGSLSVAAVTPVLANTSSTTGMQTNNVMNGNGYGTYGTTGNGTFGTGTGNGTFGTNGTYGTYGTNGTGTYGSGYGTNAFDGNRAGTYGTYDRTRMNAFSGTRATTNNLRTNNYRAAATTTNNRGFSWGWLGLIGLFGLAGMRSRSRDDIR